MLCSQVVREKQYGPAFRVGWARICDRRACSATVAVRLNAMECGKSLQTCRSILALLVAGGMVLMGDMPPLEAQETLDTLQLPLGLSARFASIPPENPLTAAKVALGQQLFWDRRWSKTGTVACVDCHQPEHGWSDPRPFSLDHAGQPTARHS